MRAFGDCRCIVRKHATSGLASSREPRDALKDILQAADRYLTSPNNASANVPSCEWAGYKDSIIAEVQSTQYSPAHMQSKVS